MQPSVELSEDFEEGKDTQVTVALEVLPVVPAPSIEGLKLERLIVDVSDEQVDEAVKRLAEQSQRFADAPAKHKAKAGDQVIMDYAGKVDGVPFDGGTGTDMAVTIGSGNLIPGFEDSSSALRRARKRRSTSLSPRIMARRTSRARTRPSISRSLP